MTTWFSEAALSIELSTIYTVDLISVIPMRLDYYSTYSMNVVVVVGCSSSIHCSRNFIILPKNYEAKMLLIYIFLLKCYVLPFSAKNGFYSHIESCFDYLG